MIILHLLKKREFEILKTKYLDIILKELSDNNFIYTHKGSTCFEMLKKKDIDLYFTEVVTSESNFPRKPEPDALLYLIDKYALNKNTTYYIGDRDIDIMCAINAGIKSIYLGDKLNDHATFCINEMIELKDIFKLDAIK
jgi:HAD superfamily hydrolase (TIGR01549 family)